jgi:uncharacterized protein
MEILITGGTGFIGSYLSKRLLGLDHKLTILTRNSQKVEAPNIVINSIEQLSDNQSFDVVINLAGEPIADKRWSEAQKNKIISSRITISQQLVEFIKRSNHKPQLFISGSAIGYYGIEQSDQSYDETYNSAENNDHSFSSQLCLQWEAVAQQVQDLGIRTCILRTGIVLGEQGGALAKMLPPFKLGLGGKMGTGHQWMSWLHIDDAINIIVKCIEDTTLNGAINLTAPKPVTNKEFTQTLGKVLNRPTLISMPEFAVKLLFGQMGEELLLSGRAITPRKLLDCGYQFKYPSLQSALEDLLRK